MATLKASSPFHMGHQLMARLCADEIGSHKKPTIGHAEEFHQMMDLFGVYMQILNDYQNLFCELVCIHQIID